MLGHRAGFVRACIRKNRCGILAPRSVPGAALPPAGPVYLTQSARLKQTALVPNEHSEWVEITHPFHPLRGQQFVILKERRVANIPTLVLRGSDLGTFAVPLDWTSNAIVAETPTIFDASCLLQLSELVVHISKRSLGEGVDQ